MDTLCHQNIPCIPTLFTLIQVATQAKARAKGYLR